jgi:hypothetical protein
MQSLTTLGSVISGFGAFARLRRGSTDTRAPRRRRSAGPLLLISLALTATIAVPVSMAGQKRIALPKVDSSRLVPMGVYNGAGNPAGVARFEAQLGRKVELAHDYLDRRSWQKIADVGWSAERWRQAGYAGRMVFTVPMLPNSGANLRQGAAGRYNHHFRKLARGLVAHGHGTSTLRLGPEFNGRWYTWSMVVRNGARDYARYWRHIVRTMRSVKGANFRFDWAPNAGSAWVDNGRTQVRAASAYPGDKWVDYIGLDVYDQSWAPDSNDARKRWKEFVNQRDGLRWHVRFAAARNKPMSIPEWGLAKRQDGRGGGDNPYFISQMHKWIQSHVIAYHLYFESTDSDAQYSVFSGGFPRAAKRFVQTFGGGT